jgi:RHS repeat-associated protein
LASVNLVTNFISSYYDGLGRLRRKLDYTWSGSAWVFQQETRYIYHGRRVIQERNGTDVPQVAYTLGWDVSGSFQGAGGIGGLLARSHGCSAGAWSTHHAYHADGVGNITAMVGTGQTLSANYEYDPFANLVSSSGGMAGANLYRFSSKEFVSQPGQYYYGFRFYPPHFQRWINQDPLGQSSGINLVLCHRGTDYA